jgi:AcrR family transcriptional regulator
VGRRETKKARIRRALIDAAAEVFVERGYEAATLDDMAARAGLTKGAVYSNFKSKADLAFAVLDERVSKPLIELLGMLDRSDGADQIELRSESLGSALDAMEPWFVLDLEFTTHALRSRELLARLQEREKQLRRMAAERISEMSSAKGRRSSVDAEALVVAMTSVTDGIALARLKDRGAVPEDLLSRLIVGVLLALR